MSLLHTYIKTQQGVMAKFVQIILQAYNLAQL